GFVERSLEGGAGSQAMAAAAETLGQAGNVERPAAEAHLHAAARLLHEEHADLDADHATSKVYQVLGVLWSSFRQIVIAALNFAARPPAVLDHLQAVKNQAHQLQTWQRITLEQLIVQQFWTRAGLHQFGC